MDIAITLPLISTGMGGTRNWHLINYFSVVLKVIQFVFYILVKVKYEKKFVFCIIVYYQISVSYLLSYYVNIAPVAD